MVIAGFTLVFSITVSLRTAYAKRKMKEKQEKTIQTEIEVSGILSNWFLNVSRFAWSSIDLASLYVR